MSGSGSGSLSDGWPTATTSGTGTPPGTALAGHFAGRPSVPIHAAGRLLDT